jgi:hypothetical protein
MGPTALLPLRRKACCGFLLLSSEFEQENLGSNGKYTNHQTRLAQHTTRGPLAPPPTMNFLWPVREFFVYLSNRFDFLEHFLSQFEHNAQSASGTSFLSIEIQNTVRLSPPSCTLVTTNEPGTRNCSSFLHTDPRLLRSCAGLH